MRLLQDKPPKMVFIDPNLDQNNILSGNRKQGQEKSNQNLSGVGLLKSLPLLTSWRQSADLRPSHNNDIDRA